MKTLKAFIAKSHLPESLIRAVVRQCGGWESFKESAPDVSRHGASGGFSGFIYYTETIKFARKNRASILEAAEDLARDIGDGDAYTMIANFNCLRDDGLTAGSVAKAIHTGKGEDVTSIYNALAWFALEEVSRSFCDLEG